jgi:hypothetical protein
VTEDFVIGGNWTLPSADEEHVAIVTQLQREFRSYQRLEPEDCIKRYGVDLLSDRRHVVVVTLADHPDNAVLGTMDWEYSTIQNSWICFSNVTEDMQLVPMSIDDFDCTVEEALANLPMIVADEEVAYCLSQTVPDICRLQFSLPIMVIVIFCNVVKLVCILLTLWKHRITLVTLGDAIASFLERPDPTTEGMCTMTLADAKSGWWLTKPSPRPWEYTRYSRWQAVGKARWISTNLL